MCSASLCLFQVDFLFSHFYFHYIANIAPQDHNGLPDGSFRILLAGFEASQWTRYGRILFLPFSPCLGQSGFVR
jgi:hypothetical protein